MNGVIGAGVILSVMGGGVFYNVLAKGIPAPFWVAHLRSGINFVAWPTWSAVMGALPPFPRPGRRPHVQHPFLGGVWVCAGVEWLVPKSPVAFHSLGLLPVCPLSKFSAGTGISIGDVPAAT